jgi:hypothetical protein
MANPYTPPNPPGWTPAMTWGPPAVTPPDTSKTDIAGLSKIWTAAAVAIAGSVLGIVVLVAVNVGYVQTDLPMSGSPLSVATTGLEIVVGVGLVGLVISVVSFWYYRDGFVFLRTVDTRFSSTPTWLLLVIAGIVFVGIALTVLLWAILSLVSCAGNATVVPPSCIVPGNLLGPLALLLLAGIIALVGFIGTLVGIWRLGDRYGNSLFKIGAVLLIIPYVNIIGQILILVAAGGARAQIKTRPGAGFMTMPSVMSPPAAP